MSTSLTTRQIKDWLRAGGVGDAYLLSLEAVLAGAEAQGGEAVMPAPIGRIVAWEVVTVSSTRPLRETTRIYVRGEGGQSFYTNLTGQWWMIRPEGHPPYYTRSERSDAGRYPVKLDFVVGILPAGMEWEPTADPLQDPVGIIVPDAWGTGTDNPDGSGGGSGGGGGGLVDQLTADPLEFAKSNPILVVGAALLGWTLLRR